MRTTGFSPCVLAATLVLALAGGCDTHVPAASPAADIPAAAPALHPRALPGSRPLDDQWLFVSGPVRRIEVSRQAGLAVRDASGAVRLHVNGDFEHIDVSPATPAPVHFIASVERRSGQLVVVRVAGAERSTAVPTLRWPAGDFAVEALCLYRHADGPLYLFALGEAGVGVQWLVADGDTLLDRARPVRRLALPPDTTHCAVDARHDRLFVSEENVGIWVYPAGPEAALERRPVDLLAPFGSLPDSPAGLAMDGDDLLALVPGRAELRRYRADGAGWQHVARHPLDGLESPERLHHTGSGLLIADEDGWHSLALPAVALPAVATPAITMPAITMPAITTSARPPRPVPVVATVQTTPLAHAGDAADDPAIWVHPTAPAQSRILGTDKQRGLEVYDLDGKRLQSLPVGRLNNVDLRRGFALGTRRIDLAVATQRDHNSLQLFAIDPASGQVSTLGELPTPLTEIYGLCLFQSPYGRLDAVVNDKDGRFLHYTLDAPTGTPRATLRREFRVASQPEGCVADDSAQRLFIGEEDVGVWTLDARPEAPARLEKILAVGPIAQADIEGMAVYDGRYLIVSSQGNDRYLVLDAAPPFALRGQFRITANIAAGIDGVSETDGLDVTAAALGPGFEAGLLVVQDGRKRMPEAPQNFKYVPWAAIADTLKLR